MEYRFKYVRDVEESWYQKDTMITEGAGSGRNPKLTDAENLHNQLDLIGCFVSVADGVNAGVYLVEGEKTEAAIAALGIIPGVKVLEKGKGVIKVIAETKEAENCLKTVVKDAGTASHVGSDVGKGSSKAELGKKLDYIFGNATGSKHNIDRSVAMERQLNSIGIFNNAEGRNLVEKNLIEAFNNPASILKTQENGRIVRESLLSGPNGVIKVESVWDGSKLITATLFGGK